MYGCACIAASVMRTFQLFEDILTGPHSFTVKDVSESGLQSGLGSVRIKVGV